MCYGANQKPILDNRTAAHSLYDATSFFYKSWVCYFDSKVFGLGIVVFWDNDLNCIFFNSIIIQCAVYDSVSIMNFLFSSNINQRTGFL